MTSELRPILLVDDDAPSRRIIKLILQQEGFELVESASREEALNVVEEASPRMVLMDYLMPGLSPADFIEKLRGAGYNGPIVLCTAMKRELNLAVDDVVFKPFNPDDLVKQVKALLSTWAVAGD